MSVIVREWRGRAALGQEQAYPRHFHDHVLPGLRKVDGFLGARLLRRKLPPGSNGAIEFVVLTRWSSLHAIKAFAGQDMDKAVVEPGAIAALVDYDREVRHYEMLQETSVDA
jgi:heme-degrading monooxygenase HmoA